MMDLTDNSSLSAQLEETDRHPKDFIQTSKSNSISGQQNDPISEEIISPLSPIKSRRGAIDLNQGVLDDIEVYTVRLPCTV